jgi:hypothetical protein
VRFADQEKRGERSYLLSVKRENRFKSIRNGGLSSRNKVSRIRWPRIRSSRGRRRGHQEWEVLGFIDAFCPKGRLTGNLTALSMAGYSETRQGGRIFEPRLVSAFASQSAFPCSRSIDARLLITSGQTLIPN